MDEIFEIINPDNTIGINRRLAHALGLNAAAVYGALLSKLAYYREREMTLGGWFYSTVEDLCESTSLSARRQRSAITALERAGLIKAERRGLPARRYFYIVEDAELLRELLGAPAAREKAPEEPAAPAAPAEQARTERTNKFEQKRTASSDENAQHTYKTKEINHNFYQSSFGDDMIGYPKREYWLETLRENLSYENLMELNKGDKRVDELISVMTGVICSQKPTVRVNGEEHSRSEVAERFLTLDSEHIGYVLMALDDCAPDIRNMRSYLITALYNAPDTITAYYEARVARDFPELYSRSQKYRHFDRAALSA